MIILVKDLFGKGGLFLFEDLKVLSLMFAKLGLLLSLCFGRWRQEAAPFIFLRLNFRDLLK